jgi:hypothetical protein
MGFFGLIVCALYSISISKLRPFRMEAFISFLRDMIRRYAPTLFQDWAPVVDAEHPEEWIKRQFDSINSTHCFSPQIHALPSTTMVYIPLIRYMMSVLENLQ